ncbi:hypothetical protein CRE_30749 [Caenorhabditis remanei]|uniref:Peptidase A2 domain-containing protein n=1 Tax=Caenorhabditis remanei TaxID=31234 RepID=E3LU29_CAERE|nr:hypothetical protein CRE_30749 [Caenorhabditis remanei]
MVTYTIGSYKIRHKTHFTVSRCTPDPFGGAEIIIGTDFLSRLPPVQFDFRNARLQIGEDAILLGSMKSPQILFSKLCNTVSLAGAISSFQQFSDPVQEDRDNKSVQFKNRSSKQSRNRNSRPRSIGHQTQVPRTTEISSHVRLQEVSDESRCSRPNQ